MKRFIPLLTSFGLIVVCLGGSALSEIRAAKQVNFVATHPSQLHTDCSHATGGTPATTGRGCASCEKNKAQESAQPKKGCCK